MIKTGIIGCGNIGTEIGFFLSKSRIFSLDYVCDIDKTSIENFLRKIKNEKIKAVGFDELLQKADLIIEAANKEAASGILKNKNFSRKNKKILVMSTGGLFENISMLDRIKNAEICVPSGAIAGLDAIKAVRGRIKALSLTTTKPIKGLEGAPYIAKKGIDLKKIKSKKIIFEGGIKDAIKGFPSNINVAASLFLASRFKGIKIRIAADPKGKLNVHEIACDGDFGRILTRTENKPSKNPKTSYLAVLSALRALRNIGENLKIGN